MAASISSSEFLCAATLLFRRPSLTVSACLEFPRVTSSTSLLSSPSLASLAHLRVQTQAVTKMMLPSATMQMIPRAINPYCAPWPGGASLEYGVAVAAEVDMAVVLGAVVEVLCSRLLKFELGIVPAGSTGVKIGAIETIVPKRADRGWRVGMNVSGFLVRRLIVIIKNDSAIPVEVSVVLRGIGGSGIIRVFVLVL